MPNCPKCGYNDKREVIKELGLIVEPILGHPWGKWCAYREDGWLSKHFANTREQVIENAMNELDRCLKKLE